MSNDYVVPVEMIPDDALLEMLDRETARPGIIGPVVRMLSGEAWVRGLLMVYEEPEEEEVSAFMQDVIEGGPADVSGIVPNVQFSPSFPAEQMADRVRSLFPSARDIR